MKTEDAADIEALPEGARAELIDGELFTMAAPLSIHQDLLGELTMQIRLYIKQKGGKCKAYPAPYAVYLKNDERNYVEPDISVVCDKNKMGEKGCLGAPDLIIEIVSPSSRHMDYERKLPLYRDAGVREYWIADPKRKIVTVYDTERGAEGTAYSFSEKIKVGIYEDLYLDLAGWAESA